MFVQNHPASVWTMQFTTSFRKRFVGDDSTTLDNVRVELVNRFMQDASVSNCSDLSSPRRWDFPGISPDIRLSLAFLEPVRGTGMAPPASNSWFRFNFTGDCNLSQPLCKPRRISICLRETPGVEREREREREEEEEEEGQNWKQEGARSFIFI